MRGRLSDAIPRDARQLVAKIADEELGHFSHFIGLGHTIPKAFLSRINKGLQNHDQFGFSTCFRWLGLLNVFQLHVDLVALQI